MFGSRYHIIIRYFIALVWLINGLYCKLLHMVPRHEIIVQHILQTTHAAWITRGIGIAEIGMSVWVLSNYKPRFNAIVQIIIVALMNLLEFMIVPDMLLWGRMNAVYALMFIILIVYSEFIGNPATIKQHR